MSVEPMFAPDGTRIIGVLQTMEAVALIEGIDIRDADTIYSGETRMLWETMTEKITSRRRLVYIDANGRQWDLTDLRTASGNAVYRYRPSVRDRKRSEPLPVDVGQAAIVVSSGVT